MYTYIYVFILWWGFGRKIVLSGCAYVCVCSEDVFVSVYACLFLCLFVCVYTQRIPLPFFDDEARGLVDCTTAPHIKHIRSVNFHET